MVNCMYVLFDFFFYLFNHHNFHSELAFLDLAWLDFCLCVCCPLVPHLLSNRR